MALDSGGLRIKDLVLTVPDKVHKRIREIMDSDDFHVIFSNDFEIPFVLKKKTFGTDELTIIMSVRDQKRSILVLEGG